jgi:putrescine aminotransferase
MRSTDAKPKAARAALRDQCIADAREFLIPGRVSAYEQMGVMPVLGSAEGYRFRDLNGKKYQDFHLNGGTFNLGHRNPELIAILKRGFRKIGIGNHHFVNCARAQLAKRLINSVPGAQYSVFAVSGSEANDVAIKSARHATGRRKVVSMQGGYHGRTGLSGSAGDAENAKFFNSELPEFSTVPFNDLPAMADALKARDVAAIIVESLPATAGFLRPAPGYLAAVSDLCEEFGTLYIADEVQTGLGRTGALWSFSRLGGRPDILVTAKGFSGGIYPIAATVLSERAGAWLRGCGLRDRVASA